MAKQRKPISKAAWDRADPGERAAMILGVLTGKRMDQEKLTKLLEVADQQNQAKLRVLHNTVVNCLLELKQKKPGAKARIDDLKAAERALEDFAETLWEQHFKEETKEAEGQPESLPNLLAVVDYLGKQGWSIKKSAVYKHRKEGKIRPGKDGKYKIRDVEEYAKKNLQRLDGSDPVADSLLEEKARAEVRYKTAKATREEMALSRDQGELISRDEVQAEWSSRNVELKTALLAWANKLPPLLYGREKREMASVLWSEVHHLLDRFSRTGKWTPSVRNDKNERRKIKLDR